ncbi:hypothetical protein [Winogradskyella sp.]|uniref:hypothetical protein n=1 Tax=Winogradskyella sp. TaxID=1883156 RepID=UPI003BAAA026
MNDLYRHALDKFIDLSTKDVTAALSKENAIIGLQKLLSSYQENNISFDNVNVVALPDFTFTRNQLRWNAGFAYGCIIMLEPSENPIIPLEFRPNCCGVILSKIRNWDGNRKSFCERLVEIIKSYEKIDLDDFKRRNHFVSILQDRNDDFYCLFHGSFASVKRDSESLPGLYTERSQYWEDKTKTNASFKDFKYLIGNPAKEYFDIYKIHEAFTIRQRELIFDDLFDDNHTQIFNSTHEGFFDINTILLGGYVDARSFECPIMLSPESSIPIVENCSSLRDLTENKCNSNLYCAPHGGGYAWPYVESAVIENGTGQNYAQLTMTNNQSVMFCDNIGDMPFQYRTNVANFWVEDKGAGRIVNDLQPIFFAKF